MLEHNPPFIKFQSLNIDMQSSSEKYRYVTNSLNQNIYIHEVPEPKKFIVAGLYKGKLTEDKLTPFIESGLTKFFILSDEKPETIKGNSEVIWIKEPELPDFGSSSKSKNKFYVKSRIFKLGFFREFLKNYIKFSLDNEKYCEIEYVLLVDFDLEIPMESICHITSDTRPYDKRIVTSLGVQIKTYGQNTDSLKTECNGSILYYDTSAYRPNKEALTDPNYIHNNLNSHLHAILGGVIKDVLDQRSLTVGSAFGGMARYPINLYVSGSYSPMLNLDLLSPIECECEHVSFIRSLQGEFGMEVEIDPKSITIYN